MLIVADENIPLLESFFGDFGEVRRVAGRTVTAAHVQDADILLVRSVTSVNQALLDGSRVRFVGTATIGTNHIDQNWLAAQGIAFQAAPGCNATSVVEYVLSLLSLHAERRCIADWTSLSVGIVGAGNVGGELARTLRQLGFSVKVNDPPLEALGNEAAFVTLDEVLSCDVVTLHTPLTTTSVHPTYRLIGEQELGRLQASQLLINAGRGEVIDGDALLRRLGEAAAPVVALDVWENEPMIQPELVDRVWIATPHIAGYSLEGKARGTEMIYRAVCDFLKVPAAKQISQFLPAPALESIAFSGTAQEVSAITAAMRACYDPRRDDASLRQTMTLTDANQRAAAFDQLRKNYPVRREHSSVKVSLAGASQSLRGTFQALGFSSGS